ncbi:glycosyltransferase [Vibrio cholerae]
MSKKIIFHHPLPLNFNAPSGSGIRPVEMYKAFLSLGYEVDLVTGYSNERSSNISIIIEKIKNGHKYDFCYSEASTMPLALTDLDHYPRKPFMDIHFFRYLKKNKIKIGVFYRDIYWKFSDKDKVSFLNKCKKTISELFYKLELIAYEKYIDIVFIPSFQMGEYIPFIDSSKFQELNPGTKKVSVISHIPTRDKIEILYIGGTTGFYNIDLFINVISKYFGNKINLTICTRENDANILKSNIDYMSDNVEIVSLCGEELFDLYKKCDCVSLYLEPSEYRTFAVPVKLFEYISYGKPIITTQGTWAGKFVINEKVGWSVPYSERELCDFLNDLYEKRSKISIFSNFIAQKATSFSWENRCKEVDDLLRSNK